MDHKAVDLISNDVPESIEHLFMTFIDSFRIDDEFVYKSQLNRSILTESYCITIALAHISSFSNFLYDSILADPSGVINKLENSLTKKYILNEKTIEEKESDQNGAPFNLINFSIHFDSSANFTPIRMINTSYNNRLIRLKGIVVSVSTPVYKPKMLFLVCKRCLRAIKLSYIPRTCSATCGLDPFEIDASKSLLVDEQIVKIQEMFEDIPAGELPRHFMINLERSLVDTVQPGDHIKVTGIIQLHEKVLNKKVSQSLMLLKSLGLEKEKKNKHIYFTDKERAFFLNFSKYNVHNILLNMFAPQIHGHFDIKKAILCLLFGGTRRTKHGVNLRSDINILLLGDPGCAKSQLLKFTNMISPGVYTSGKGSSAAGLTACVIKRKSGEFALEGGALVLSDYGTCCIDEFDKMNPNDRVSIHEAMEQQTISISKAGINTMLNTRCSVLAAANPVFGRYDEYKNLSDNIDFGSTILSRFDCIFIIKDKENRDKDMRLARHLLNLNIHQNVNQNGQYYKQTHSGDIFGIISSQKGSEIQDLLDLNTKKTEISAYNKNKPSNLVDEKTLNSFDKSVSENKLESSISYADDKDNIINSNKNVDISDCQTGEDLFKNINQNNMFSSSIDFMQKYIAFSKSTVFPTLNKNAQNKLINFYTQTRKAIKYAANTIPITVRQLESLIRMSEALAKMELKKEVGVEHVDEAIRLFTTSTIEAVNQGHCVEGMVRKENEVFIVSERIKKELPLGIAISYEKILNKMVDTERHVTDIALNYLVKMGKVAFKENGQQLLRLF
ncbi:hypothetical protein EDEG_00222, partial [Edhazardia aedis USNM 41457]